MVKLAYKGAPASRLRNALPNGVGPIWMCKRTLCFKKSPIQYLVVPYFFGQTTSPVRQIDLLSYSAVLQDQKEGRLGGGDVDHGPTELSE